MSKDLKLFLAKFAIYSGSKAIFKKGENFTDKDNLLEILIFSLGISIEELYLNSKGQYFKFFEDKDLNQHMQNLLFSTIFQFFGSTLFIDEYENVGYDFVNLLITYGATLPIVFKKI